MSPNYEQYDKRISCSSIRFDNLFKKKLDDGITIFNINSLDRIQEGKLVVRVRTTEKKKR